MNQSKLLLTELNTSGVIFSLFCCFGIAAEKKSSNKVTTGTDNPNTKPDPTWVHEIFQGTLTNETRCLNCETVSKTFGFLHKDSYLFIKAYVIT